MIQVDDFLRVPDTPQGRAFAHQWAEIGDRQLRNLDRCVAMLQRGYGVKIVSPDDGWIDRRRNTFFPPSYARRLGPVGVGDRIALGSETTDLMVIGHFRIVRVVAVGRPGLFTGEPTYEFEEEVTRFEMVGPELATTQKDRKP
jgi:hypothetical protein